MELELVPLYYIGLVVGHPFEPVFRVCPPLAVGIHLLIRGPRTVANPDEGGRTMSIGAGIALVVIGLVLLLGVVQVDIPWVDDYTLGILLTLAGVIALVLIMSLGRRLRR
jgi:hypothetical protein